MIKIIGLINKSAFTYWEENDWCMRGYKKGYDSFYAPKSKIWHKISSSDISEIKYYYLTRNRIWFMKKYAPPQYLFTFFFYLFTFNLLLEIRDFFKDKKSGKFVYFLKGIKDGLKRSE
jgi:GT2 family glycosyltransferase